MFQIKKTIKPFRKAKRKTIRNWIHKLMTKAGIDVTKYKVHSTHAASTSKAANILPSRSVMKAAGWASGSTFARHYHRPIVSHDEFAEAVLQPTHHRHH